tara:strand:+ start:84 stop:506 length:423 start_codon:yes stop_codon:yes gene_type:complete
MSDTIKLNTELSDIDNSLILEDIDDVDTDIDDNDFSINNIDSSDEEYKEKKILYRKGKDRLSKPIITHYEKVRIIGTRKQQIISGAKILIKHDNINSLSIEEIVKLEWNNNMIPYIIQRPLPDGSFDIFEFTELQKNKIE